MAHRSRTEEIFYDFLVHNHERDALRVLEEQNPDKHYSIEFLFARLPMEVANGLFKNSALQILQEMDRAVISFIGQMYEWNRNTHDNLILKRYVHARVYALPENSGHILTTFPQAYTETKFCAVHGIVIKTNQRKLIEHSRYFKCTNCQLTTVVPAIPSRAYEFPKEVACEQGCSEGNVIQFNQQELTDNIIYSSQKDYQQIRIQECKDVKTDSLAKSMTVDLDNDLVDRVLPGNQLCITGTVLVRVLQHKKNKKIQAETFMIANHIEIINDIHDASVVSSDSMHFFNEFWKSHQENPYLGKNMILRSFAPHVYAMRWVKEGLMTVLAGIPTATSNPADKTRGNPHMLICGDSGLSKTKLLKYCKSLIPGSVSGSGSGYTEAGLSVAAVYTSNGWMLEPGLLALASYSLAVVDEINIMKDADKQILHESMEHGSISFSKAGINATLKTKCSLLTACNPKFDRYDKTKDLGLNIGLSGPLTSRFDLIFLLQDEKNHQWDSLLADHILGIKENDGLDAVGLWSHDSLREYFAHVKTLQPKMNKEMVEILGSYYRIQRSKEDRDTNRTTPRLLDTLQRLAIAHARLMFRDTVIVHDCVIAIKLVDQSFGSNAICGNDNVVQSTIPKNPTGDYYLLAEKILKTLGFITQWEKEKRHLYPILPRINEVESSPDSPAPSTSNARPRPHNASIVPSIFTESDSDDEF